MFLDLADADVALARSVGAKGARQRMVKFYGFWLELLELGFDVL